MRILSVAALLLSVSTGCGRAHSEITSAVRLDFRRGGGEMLLTLYAVAGARISAVAKPTIELSNGDRIVLDSDSVTADGAYFTAPPTARVRSTARIDGTLRAGVCPAGLRVCQTVTLVVIEPD